MALTKTPAWKNVATVRGHPSSASKMSSIYASSSVCRSSTFSRQALLPTIALLSLQGGMASYKSDASREESCSNPNIVSEDVPSRISHLVTDVLKVYSTKSVEEQTAIVNKYYHPEHSSFVDPLMKVDTPREINLAFISLIKLFKDIQVDQKSLALNPKPRLPSHLKAANTQQYVVHNQQIYHLERSNAIARCLLPGTVDLDVNTYLTIDPQSGKIVYHEDVWNNKSFGFPGFAKQPNGVLSSWIFKAAGWGKEAYAEHTLGKKLAKRIWTYVASLVNKPRQWMCSRTNT